MKPLGFLSLHELSWDRAKLLFCIGDKMTEALVKTYEGTLRAAR